MPGRISEDLIEEIRTGNDIVGVISEYVPLKKQGKNYVGLCPFHDDHAPSLWVYPPSGLWGCNKPSCQAAGIHDVINFRALAHGLTNSMAIRQLAAEGL